MVMDMGRDAEQDAVELNYRPLAGDFTDALRERERLRRRRWRRYWAVGLVGFAVVLNGALAVAGSAKPDWFLLTVLPLGLALVVFTPWLQARAFLRLAARQGAYRATVADAGVTVANEHSTTTVVWAAQPRYRETKDVFVTYSDDKNASCFTVLPKRGLQDPADVDRLRAVLDRHLARA